MCLRCFYLQMTVWRQQPPPGNLDPPTWTPEELTWETPSSAPTRPRAPEHTHTHRHRHTSVFKLNSWLIMWTCYAPPAGHVLHVLRKGCLLCPDWWREPGDDWMPRLKTSRTSDPADKSITDVTYQQIMDSYASSLNEWGQLCQLSCPSPLTTDYLLRLTCRKSILATPPTNRLMPGFRTNVRGTMADVGTTDLTSCSFNRLRIWARVIHTDREFIMVCHDSDLCACMCMSHVVVLHDPRRVVQPVSVLQLVIAQLLGRPDGTWKVRGQETDRSTSERHTLPVQGCSG